MQDLVLGVGDFVGLLNQTLEFAYPSVTIEGELANFRISKNKWVYFDLKDDVATVRCFGTVYQLQGPLEDGMLLQVRAVPRVHPLYGFSLNLQSLRPVGEGSIKKAAALVQAKLAAEGLFDENRKRAIAYPPRVIGLVASAESAAYADFIKVLGARWGGITIHHVNVQVQGEAAPSQIVSAIAQLNEAELLDVIVVIRGGGSPEDLAAFSSEAVTRAVAASRIPTLVAIGHEIDISLAELAADKRASTPSNAAELLVPDKHAYLQDLQAVRERLTILSLRSVLEQQNQLQISRQYLDDRAEAAIKRQYDWSVVAKRLLSAYDPQAALKRGYALVRHNNQIVRSVSQVTPGETIHLQLVDGDISATVT